MKRIFVLFILMATAIFAFTDGFSGETTGKIGVDIDGVAPIYSIDAGVVYKIGIFSIGLDAFTDTFKDFDVGLPMIIGNDTFSVNVEPGVDNIFEGTEIFTIDGGISLSVGIFSFAYSAGYGTDEVLSMSGSATLSPWDFLSFKIEYADGDDVFNGANGDVSLSCTVSY